MWRRYASYPSFEEKGILRLMEELNVTAAKKRATYEEIKAYVLKHSGLISIVV